MSKHVLVSSATATGSAARGAKITLLGQWGKFSVQLAATVVLARVLSPTDFGLFSMIVAFTGLATLLGDFGLSSATMQAKHLSNQQRSNLFWINLGIGTLCSAVVFFCAPLIAGFYGQPKLMEAVQLLSPTFLLQSVISQLAANSARGLKFGLLAASDVIAQLIGFLCALLLALNGAGVAALVVQQIAVAVTTVVILFVSTLWFPKLPRRAEMKALLSFGRNSFLVQLLTYVSSNADSVLLGRFWGAASLGLYDRAYQLFRMPIQQLATPLTRVVLPLLSRRQDELDWVSEKLVQLQRLLAYVVGGLFVAASATAWPLISLLLGDNWIAAAPILAILGIGGLFQSMGYVYYWAFLVTNKTGLQLRASVISRSGMVVFLIGGTFFGPIGVAAGVAAGLFFNWLLLSVWPMKRTGLDVKSLVLAPMRPLIMHLLANLPAAAGAALLIEDSTPIMYLSTQLGLTLGMYAILAVFVRPFRRDLSYLIATARKAL